MARSRKHAGDTKTRLLGSACSVFAEKGYRDATIADICDRAGANIAAVNYHFRDKETLYVEAWRQAFQRSLEAHPPDGGVPENAPVEDRLRARILSMMARIMDPECHEFEMVHKEHANPTGLLAEVMRESIEPTREQFERIVGELLGNGAPAGQVHLCAMSIIAQCMDAVMRQRHRRILPRAGPLPGPAPTEFGVEIMADHIVRFSLAGIREVRRQIDSGELADMEQPSE